MSKNKVFNKLPISAKSFYLKRFKFIDEEASKSNIKLQLEGLEVVCFRHYVVCHEIYGCTISVDCFDGIIPRPIDFPCQHWATRMNDSFLTGELTIPCYSQKEAEEFVRLCK